MIAGHRGLNDARTVRIGAGGHGEKRVARVLADDRERWDGAGPWRRYGRRAAGGMPSDRVTDDDAQLLLVHRFFTG